MKLNAWKMVALFSLAVSLLAANPLVADTMEKGEMHKTEDGQSLWRAHVAAISSDPSVARFYTFDEGEGAIAANRAGTGEGALLLVGHSPYGVYRGDSRGAPPDPADCPRWTTGRWPWKHAVECGQAPWQLVRSRYNATAAPFTVVAWMRAHEPSLYVYPGGDVLSNGPGWGAGWRLIVERPKWSPDGNAVFRIGTSKGVQSVRLGYFPFGDWHLLAAVWDGKEIRIHVDAQSATTTVDDVYVPYAPAKWVDVRTAGLAVGGSDLARPGALRFDIDELRVYERALSPAEVTAQYEQFRPQASEAEQQTAAKQAAALRAKRDAIVFDFPTHTGGYVAKGTPIKMGVSVPDVVGWQLPLTLRVSIAARDRKNLLFEKDAELTSDTAGTAAAFFSFVPKQCGLYDVTLELREGSGTRVVSKQVPIAVTVPLGSTTNGRFSLGVRQTAVPQLGAAAVGIGWSRIVADWRQIEPKKGEYDWEEIDRRFKAAEVSGLNVLCCLSEFPAWLPLAESKRMPADRESYKKLIRIMGSRYRSETGAWEIWNPPSGPSAFFRNNSGPADYGELVTSAVAAFAVASPGCPVLVDAPAASVPGVQGVAFQYSPSPGGDALPASFARLAGAPHASVWNTVCGSLQAAGSMGAFNPADFDGPDYQGQTFTIRGFHGASIWPYAILSSRDSAAWIVREILAEHAAGVTTLILPDGLDEYYPSVNASDGTPSERGIAIAALRSLLCQATSVTGLSLAPPSPAMAFRIERSGAPAVLAVYAKDNTVVKGVLEGKVPVKGLDWLGNPLAPLVPDASGSMVFSADARPRYYFTSATPRFISQE